MKRTISPALIIAGTLVIILQTNIICGLSFRGSVNKKSIITTSDLQAYPKCSPSFVLK
jgi:hypothetical protein